MRSILLTNAMRGTPYLSAWRHTVSDWGSHAADRAEHDDGAVEHAQGALHLDGEVDVARGVDDVDAVLVATCPCRPERGRGSGRDGDAALLLLLHPVHGGLAVVDLADLVDYAGVEEDPLGVVVLPASMWAMMPMFRFNGFRLAQRKSSPCHKNSLRLRDRIRIRRYRNNYQR